MTKLALRIEQPGLLTTLQDLGRFGQLARGITRGGPVDERAFLWGNKLLGNVAAAAQLEVTLGSLVVTALSSGFWVVCGAPVRLFVNAQAQPIWQVFPVNVGDRIEIQPPERGLRSYLAVAGGLSAEPVYGSVATVMRDGLGGLNGDGAPLRVGDEVALGKQQRYPATANRRPQHELIPRVSATSELTLNVLPLAHFQQLDRAQQQRLFAQTYTVTAQQDRMGVRVKADLPIEWTRPQIISEPLPIGAIQIPPDGQPIMMLNDAQTLGGYPKVGVLSWSARMALAQAQAGTKVRLAPIDLATAQAEQLAVERFFSSVG